MKNRIASVKLFTLIALVTVAAAGMTIKSSARQTRFVERALNFSSIGITRGQTVRLHGLAVGPCNIPVEFVFLDSEGRVLQQTNQNIDPEHFESFDLNFDSLGLPDKRLQLRVLVKYLAHAEHADERVFASLEVFDNKTNKTNFVLSVPEPPERALPAR